MNVKRFALVALIAGVVAAAQPASAQTTSSRCRRGSRPSIT